MIRIVAFLFLALFTVNASNIQGLIEENEAYLFKYAELLRNEDKRLESSCDTTCIGETDYACTGYRDVSKDALKTVSGFGASQRCKEQSGCDDRKLNFEASTYRTASLISSPVPATLASDICIAKTALDNEFKKDGKRAFEENLPIKWRYLGSPTGVFTQYPGSLRYNCTDYDPRIRPWYVGATSGPKDVVIILDTSGSMIQQNRLEIMKEAVISVLDTLNSNDFFNILLFADNARLIDPAYTSVIPATNDNIKNFKAKVNDISASGGTNFGAAFKAARPLFTTPSSDTSGCHKLALFLTDGADQNDRDDTIAAAQSVQSEGVTLFTYTLGAGANKELPKSIACASDGIWGHVEDGGDLRGKMSQYYQYYEVLKSVNQSSVFWSEPYEDASGLGMVTTASLSVYDETRTPPVLIGVLGIDVKTDALRELEPNLENIIKFLNSRSKRCPAILGASQARTCVLERLRESQGSEARCDNNVSCGNTTTSLVTQRQATCLSGSPPVTFSAFEDLPDTNPFYQDQACCSSGLASWLIILIVIGSIAVSILGAKLIYMSWKRRKNNQNAEFMAPVMNPPAMPMHIPTIQEPPHDISLQNSYSNNPFSNAATSHGPSSISPPSSASSLTATPSSPYPQATAGSSTFVTSQSPQPSAPSAPPAPPPPYNYPTNPL